MSKAKELIENLEIMVESMAPPEHHEALTKAHFQYNQHTKRYSNNHTEREIQYKPRAKKFIVKSTLDKHDETHHDTPQEAIERAHAK